VNAAELRVSGYFLERDASLLLARRTLWQSRAMTNLAQSRPESTDDAIRRVLQNYRNIAVVGLSPEPSRPSYGVTQYMLAQGYDIVGVRPGTSEILDSPCYASLAEVPGELEIVDVFRAPEHIPALVEELIPLKPKVLWLQEGVTHPEAEARARRAGIEVFSDLCILKEHARLLG
jgi:predicted CoA-binding protein